MTDHLTEEDVISTVTRLTRARLVRFIEVDFVRPQQRDGVYLFRSADVARIELLCDLSEDLDLDEGALHVVLSLIDQLHCARQELAHLARALDALPPELHSRIGEALKQA